MDTLLTEIMISQGTAEKLPNGGDAATVYRISRRPAELTNARANHGHVLAFLCHLDFGAFMNDVRPPHFDLQAIAKQVMLAHGFDPNFPPQEIGRASCRERV